MATGQVSQNLTSVEFERVINSTAEGIWSIDLEGNITYVNDAGMRLFGYTSREQMIGKNSHQLVHHSHQDGSPYPRSECPIYKAFLVGTSCHLEDEVLWRADGSSFVADYRSNPIFDNGKIVGTVTTFVEKSARQKIISDNYETYLETVFDTLPLFAGSLNIDGVLNLANTLAVGVTPSTKEEIVGRYFWECPWWRSLPEVVTKLKTAIENCRLGIPERFDSLYIAHIDGSNQSRWMDLSLTPVKKENGEVLSITATGFDITDRVHLQENLKVAKIDAELASELKSAFLANMSHEIRTPLGAMLGFADLLRDPNVTPGERANYVNILTRNGAQLSVLIDDILDLSKVESGALNLEYINAHHANIGSDVVSLLNVKAKDKDLALEYTANDNTPQVITSDPTRIRQILLNLVGNAIKFTQFGSVKIHTYGCYTDKGRPSLCFEVSDTGIGMNEEQRKRLFQSFTQADETTTRRFGGTGLGLALSRRLARALGGDITVVRSQLNVGTTFLVKIPDQPELRSAPEDTFKVEIRKHHALGDLALSNFSILVVDDSPDNQQLIWRYLTKAGAVVQSAENGQIGYKAALAGNFDLILMDIQMPIMDGYTATQKLRESGYKKPIIALTAHAMNDIRKKALNVGFTDHLTKPINSSELIAAIAKYHRPNAN